jgi:hypothetical protein
MLIKSCNSRYSFEYSVRASPSKKIEAVKNIPNFALKTTFHLKKLAL